ncbi:Elg1 [Kluyveromyces lactis]|nr:Elg1 [Kluyveromyces lactis]
MGEKEGPLISNILNGYRRRGTDNVNQQSSKQDDDLAIDPALREEVEEVPSSPLRELEEPINVSSQTQEIAENNAKKRVNLKSLLSGYTKKSKPDSKQKQANKKDIILLDESPVKVHSANKMDTAHITSDGLQAAKNSNIASFLNMERSTVQRQNKISKEQVLHAPLPHIQHTPHYILGKQNSISLHKKVVKPLNLSFNASEYSFLVNSDEPDGSKKALNINDRISYSDDTTNTQLWTSLFKPTCIEDVLIDSDTKSSVREWFKDAFDLLNRKTDRSALYNRKVDGDLDNFIVDDSFLGSGDDTSVKQFVPLIILYGGIGKNTLIDVLMDEQDAHIFEINCSMNRAKRDISDMLHDFATTKYVKDTQSKGIILFDDVDVLLTESDKFFWNSVHATLIVSRRPVVITCSDYRFIPSNLLEVAEEQHSIFNIKSAPKQQIVEYTSRCLVQKGIEINKNLLNIILQRNNYHIRKCLMDLQWVCTKPGVVPINDKHSPRKRNDDTENIKKASLKLDFSSSYDVIQNCIEGKSFVRDDIDLTLNYAKHQISNDGETSYDVVWDYVEHLWDINHNTLFPWEKQMQSLMEEKCRQFLRINDKEDVNFVARDKLNICINEMIKYLKSRVNNSPQGNVLTMLGNTRSSRRKTGVIKDYRLKSEDNSDTFELEFINNLALEFSATHKLKDISRWYLPFMSRIAESETEIKNKNVSLFQRYREHYGPEYNANDIIQEMVDKRLILAAFFRGSPQEFLQAYK